MRGIALSFTLSRKGFGSRIPPFRRRAWPFLLSLLLALALLTVQSGAQFHFLAHAAESLQRTETGPFPDDSRHPHETCDECVALCGLDSPLTNAYFPSLPSSFEERPFISLPSNRVWPPRLPARCRAPPTTFSSFV